jgi:dipeptidyl aminopeptidase/acylaminoacyl peptidase
VVQLLANRGYAVLQVNYRASTGYGKRFLNLGDKQWGIGAMQHDLTDAVKWAIEKGIANPKKVCISGGSYGGYATLAGLAFTPDLYACGVDLVGISNVGTFMRSIPPYWMPLRYEWATRVGPADVDESLNRRISPMYHVDKIKAPLMIAQGAHDPRVPQAESDQMFRAMYTKRRPVQYVLYTDEGHGISKPSNRQDYYSRVEQFLAQYLGGRAAAPLKLDGVSATEVTSMVGLAAVANFANRQDKEAPVALVEAAKQRKAPAPVG